MPLQTVDSWACYLALLQVHSTIHGLFINAQRARGTASHRAASQRYHAAVAACPVLREARDAWLAAVQSAWSREAA
jgi:hypothetical protein